MKQLACKNGETQIARILQAACRDTDTISAVVFVGDHCEEDSATLVALARQLREKAIPVFVFHETADLSDDRTMAAKPVFRSIAQASGGVYCEFSGDSGEVLRELLSSVAAFAVAGPDGLERMDAVETPQARDLHARLLLGDGRRTSEPVRRKDQFKRS
jgi:hypothetical protein